MTNEAAGVFDQLVAIQNWPDAALVFAAIVVLSYISGFILRIWKRFPNDAIPLIVILVGGILTVVLADEHPKDVAARTWHLRNFIVGCVIGTTAWIGHVVLISKVEDFIAQRFSFVARLLDKGSGGAVPPPPPPPPPPTQTGL